MEKLQKLIITQRDILVAERLLIINKDLDDTYNMLIDDIMEGQVFTTARRECARIAALTLMILSKQV